MSQETSTKQFGYDRSQAYPHREEEMENELDYQVLQKSMNLFEFSWKVIKSHELKVLTFFTKSKSKLVGSWIESFLNPW